MNYLIATIFFSILSSPLLAKEIKVGGYDFPPYVTAQGGVTQKFIQLLNKNQKTHHFSFVKTTSTNRYEDLKAKKFDLILFEDKAWGWNDAKIDASESFYLDAGVYVALVEPKRNQDFFSELGSKTLLIRRGYHYGFANFNANEEYLTKNFNIKIMDTPKQIIEGLVQKKGDIAVITKSYLASYLKSHKSISKKLLVAAKLDQILIFIVSTT